MKKVFSLMLLFLILFGTGSFASDSDQGDDPGYFTRGTWKMSLYNPLKLQFGTYGTDGDKQYNWTDLRFKAAADYFFLDNFGAGVRVNLDREVEKYADFDAVDKWSEVSLDVSLLYGNRFGAINLYAKPFIGFGLELYKDEFGGNTEESKYGVFRTGVEIGSPIPIGANGHITINPMLGLLYRKYTNKDESSNTYPQLKFYAGAGVSVFLGCEDMLCDFKTGFENSMDRFSKGRNIIEASSRFKLYQYNFKETWDEGGEMQEDKDRERGLHLAFSYKRALMDRLLVGARLKTYLENYDWLEDTDYMQKTSGFYFGPVVEYHPFDQPILGNLFMEGGASFGGEKNKYIDGSNEDEFKFSIVMLDLSAGFDLGISDYWSVVGRLGVETELNKDGDGDGKANTTNGILSFGLRHSF